MSIKLIAKQMTNAFVVDAKGILMANKTDDNYRRKSRPKKKLSKSLITRFEPFVKLLFLINNNKKPSQSFLLFSS